MIYFCIPALNEARTIGVLLWKIRQVMEDFPRDYQMLVLDDGSTDDTRAVLEPYLRVLPVSVLRNERTQGYAAALERLIREAAHRSTHPKRDIVVTLQADFTEDPADIPQLLKRLEGGADVVGTVLTDPAGELPRAHRWARRGLPWLLGRARMPKEIRDPLSGFRAYRVAVLRRALQDRGGPLLTRHGWAANAELLMCVAPHVRRAEDAEVVLRYARRERPSRFQAWGTALEMWNLARRSPRVPAAQAAPEAAPAAVTPTAEAPRAPEPRQPEPQRPSRAPEPRRESPRRERPAQHPGGGRPPRQGEGLRAPDAPPQTQPEARMDGESGAEGLESAPRAESAPAAAPRRDRPRREGGRRRGRSRGQRGEADAATALDSETGAAAQPLEGGAAMPAAAGSPALDGPAEGEQTPAAEGEGAASRPRSRRGRSSRGRKRGKSAAAGAAGGTGEGGDEAAAASAAPAEAAGTPAASDASAEGGEAAPRKRSRPRRPRRPRAGREGGEGGEGGEAAAPPAVEEPGE